MKKRKEKNNKFVNVKQAAGDLKYFLFLWLTQAFSSLGSAMTNFVLVIWLYEETGETLKTAARRFVPMRRTF